MLVFFVPALSQRIQKCENGMYGLAVTKSNGSVKWLSKPRYTVIEKNSIFDYCYMVRDKDGKWGVLSVEGKEIVQCKYSSRDAATQALRVSLKRANKDYASNQSEPLFDSAFPDFTLYRDYTPYIKEYVEKNINAWQKKGEFEKTSEYQKRVTESSRNMKVTELTSQVCTECLRKVQDKELIMDLGEYDADNETFLVSTILGSFVLPVPISDAPSLKRNWPKIVSENTYDMVNGRIVLRAATFTLNNKKVAYYSDQENALYAKSNIQYNFDPIDIPINSDKTVKKPEIANNTIQVGKSDVDMNIPVNGTSDDNTFALIIANEHYRGEIPVSYAGNDGAAIEKYFSQTLGLPDNNIHFVRDATKNDMIRELDWLKNVSSVYGKDVRLLVYYAGHGVPDESDGSAYLVPVDGVGTNTKTLYSLSEMYKELGDMTTGSVVVFLDACFSGATRGEGMLTAARGIAIKPKSVAPNGNMVIFSAAEGDETAWPYEEKKHGLFTYFLLKHMQETKGASTLGDLSGYIKDQVAKVSVVVNSKKQTPTVSVSPGFSSEWSSLKLR